MQTEAIILFFIAALNSSLCLYLLTYSDSENKTPRTIFSIMLACISAWALIHLAGLFVYSPVVLTWLVRSSLISMLFVPSLFLYFVTQFPISRKISKKKILLIFLPPLILFPFSFTSLNAGGFVGDVYTYKMVMIGSLYNIFIPYCIIYFSIGLALLWNSTRTTRKRSVTLQAQLAFWGCILSVLGAVTLNGILPKWFGQQELSPNYGVFSSFIYIIPTVYAITRYRFMDIRVIVKKSTIYGVSICFVAAFIISISAIVHSLTDSIWIWVITVTLVIFFGDTFKRKIKNVLDNIFFYESLDLTKQLSNKADTIHPSKEIELFLDNIIKEMEDNGAIQVNAIFLKEASHKRYVQYYPKESHEYIAEDNQLVSILSKESMLVNMSSMDLNISKERAYLLKYFQKYAAQYILQFRSGRELLGFCILQQHKKNNTSSVLMQKLQNISHASINHLMAVLYWQDTMERVKFTIKEQDF